MHFNFLKIIFGLCLILVFNSCNFNKKEQNTALDLTKGWSFIQDESILDTLNFPFSLIDALYEQQEIQDPNYEDELEDIKGFIKPERYSLINEFHITEKDISDKNSILKLGRIAGFADVFLNDSLILVSDSYYTRKSSDISKLMRVGSNTLKIKFKSTTESKVYPNVQKGNKQHVSFINLECKDLFKIDFIKASMSQKPYVDFAKFENDTLLAFWNIPMFSTKPQELTIEWEFEGTTYRQTAKAKKGKTIHAFYFPVVKPQYWFPYTHGKQFMYSGQLSIFGDGELLQKDSLSFAVKHLKWKNNKNQIEFVMNGKSIDVLSINYNPKNWYKTNTIQETKDYIENLKSIGVNCIRVLGDEDYLSEETLDLFDTSGMMVWQDLHINHLPQEWNVENKVSIQSDMLDLMKMYRNHPSILSLGGKSEEKRNSNEAGLIHYEVFEQVIPQIVNTFSQLEYIPNSSYVWNDLAYESATKSMSSYAFRNAWMREKNTDPWQNSWLSKQNSEDEAIRFYQEIENRRGLSSDLQGMIYHSEINQYLYIDSILAVKRGLNSNTIHLPLTYSEKGPGVHASITDYFGEKKAVYYTLKNQTKAHSVIKSEEKGVLSYFIKNNSNKELSTSVDIRIRNTNGETIDEFSQNIHVLAHQTKPILEWNKAIIPAIWKDKTLAKILDINFDETTDRTILNFDKSDIEFADCKYRVISNSNEEYIELLTQNFMPYTKFTTGNLGVFESNFVTGLPQDTIKIYFNSSDDTSPLTTGNVLFYDYSLSFD